MDNDVTVTVTAGTMLVVEDGAVEVVSVSSLVLAALLRDDDGDAAAALISVAFKVPHFSLAVQVA